MPRPAKGARLYLRRDCDPKVWVIRDGAKSVRTGASEGELELAERKLATYLAQRYDPVKRNAEMHEVSIADILMSYRVREYERQGWSQDKPKPPKARQFDAMIGRLNEFWGDMTAQHTLGQKCREFTKLRGTDSGARRDLAFLRAAIGYYRTEFGLKVDPVITLPKKGKPRERCLTREEAAKLIWVCYRDLSKGQKQLRRHLVRFILIGLYTGTRHQAILSLQWEPNEKGGHLDLERGVMYRKSASQEETSKRRPPIRIPARLLVWLKRWKAEDKGICHVVHFKGRPILRVVKAFRAARIDAKLDDAVVPHILRHTAITWYMQAGKVPLQEVAAFTGVTTKLLEETYLHHHHDYQTNIASVRLTGPIKSMRKPRPFAHESKAAQGMCAETVRELRARVLERSLSD